MLSHSFSPTCRHTLAGKNPSCWKPKRQLLIFVGLSLPVVSPTPLLQRRCAGQSITRLMVSTHRQALVPFLLLRSSEGSSKCYGDGCLRWRVAGVTAAPSCSLLTCVRGTGETRVFV